MTFSGVVWLSCVSVLFLSCITVITYVFDILSAISTGKVQKHQKTSYGSKLAGPELDA